MALVLKRLYEGYFWICENADPRSKDLVFLGSPIQSALTLSAYVYTVKVLGPKFMENRKPFNIRKLIIAYNIVQIVLNIYFAIWGFTLIRKTDFPCGGIDYGPEGMPSINYGYGFLLLKLFDWLDTVFFILKKNFRQVSFLHVYHHAMIYWGLWLGVSYFGGGNSLWLPFINSIVHAFMFTYYLLTALDSSWKNNLTIKKALTQIQLIQFAFFVVIYAKNFFLSDCDYPMFPVYALVPQNLFMLCLFGDFYLKSYVFNKQTVKSKSS